MNASDIRTERLLLRPFRYEDVADVFEYAGDPDVGRYVFAMPHPYTRADAETFVRSCVSANGSDHYNWGIELDGHVIGGIDSDLEHHHGRAAIGYALGKAHWGRGFATEAARAVVTWTFAHAGVDRVFAYADARNAASRHVLEKVGLRYEGTMRQHRQHRGEAIDEVWYGLLRSEWETRGIGNNRPVI